MAGADEIERFEREVLTGELGELGAGGGRLGGMLGGLLGGGASGAAGGGVGGAAGGRRGARSAAKRLKLNRGEESVTVSVAADDVLAAASELFAHAGEPIEEAPDTGEREVWAVMPGGSGGRNPVVTRVAATPAAGGGTTATVRTVALEGLIKQRAGEKNAVRIRDEIAQRLGGGQG